MKSNQDTGISLNWKEELLVNAEQEILKLTDSDRFKIYLETLTKFHQYSLRNINLIYFQNPRATQVAGFKQWQKLFNRSVKKGEKAIKITAPITNKLTTEDQKRLHITDDYLVIGYRYISVFDICQTIGEPVINTKNFVKDRLQSHDDVTNFYQAFKSYLNQETILNVFEKDMNTLVRGYFNPKTNEIVINCHERDSAFKLKTLYHEYAHSQLHGEKAKFKNRPRAYQEAQAEAIAYVAMKNLGIDTGDYSLGYVATWAKKKETIHSALHEIQKISHHVIEMTDHLTSELNLQSK